MWESEQSCMGVPGVENLLAAGLGLGIWVAVGGCLIHFLYGLRYPECSACLHVIYAATKS